MSQTSFKIISNIGRRKPWYGYYLYFSDSCARKIKIGQIKTRREEEKKQKEKEAEEAEKVYLKILFSSIIL